MLQEKDTELHKVHEFIVKYSTQLMGCGVHTSRVIRNTNRIGKALGYDVEVCALPQHIIVTVKCDNTDTKITEVALVPHMPINFEFNSRLSSLSWSCHDEHLTLNELKTRFDNIVNTPRLNIYKILFLASAANAAFCQLFGGDIISIGIVFIATSIAFFFRIQMQKTNINAYFIIFLTAFLASLIASVSLLFKTTSDIALATSVLFLVPGVPLINGVIDAFEGNILTGISRLIQALLIIASLASGLGVTLMLMRGGLVC